MFRQWDIKFQTFKCHRETDLIFVIKKLLFAATPRFI
jgi:hypothetical protein